MPAVSVKPPTDSTHLERYFEQYGANAITVCKLLRSTKHRPDKASNKQPPRAPKEGKKGIKAIMYRSPVLGK